MEHNFNILMATDYSKSAGNAERYAVQFSKATQSTIRFVHIFEPQLAGYTATFDAEKIDYNPLQYEFSKLNEHVTKLLDSLNIKPGELNCQCIIREGINIRKQLLDEAAESKTDLIITGTHGVSELREMMFGGHTWKIIKNTNIPLLAIPENASYSEIKKIVFATEYRKNEILSIKLLTQIAKKFNAEITVLHITNFVLPEEFENKIFENFKSELKDKITYDKLNIHLKHHYSIIDGLNDYCKLKKANWLVMSPERLSLIDKILNPADISTTKHMSSHTKVPLFIIPEFKHS
ncbi:MAG: universal stress protein [Bacteroidota bacterium]|nr:universal stress protein [Bacteroidota bacterium]